MRDVEIQVLSLLELEVLLCIINIHLHTYIHTYIQLIQRHMNNISLALKTGLKYTAMTGDSHSTLKNNRGW